MIIDTVAANAAREEGIAAADAGADEAWKAEALATIEVVARRQQFLHGDDIWAAGLPRCRENRALGPVFRRAAKAGLIRFNGWTKSSVVENHRNPHGLWESLIYPSNLDMPVRP